MSLPPLIQRSVTDLYQERRNLEDLCRKVEANEIQMPYGDWSIKDDIVKAITDINGEIDRRFDRLFEHNEAAPYAMKMAEWLERVVREAEEKGPTLQELKQRVQHATDALEGLEGNELAQALSVQGNAIWALIDRTSTHHRGGRQ